MRELAKVRRNGFAIDHEEHEPHVGCIAAPLWDYSQKVIASVGITAILYHTRIEELVANKELLLATCEEISKSLGFRGMHR
jgi:DNA-binding IclR family transcriptional regulator